MKQLAVAMGITVLAIVLILWAGYGKELLQRDEDAANERILLEVDVANSLTGDPLPGATVRLHLRQEEGRRTVVVEKETDVTGAARLRATLPRDRIVLTVEKPDYEAFEMEASELWVVTGLRGEWLTLDVPLEPIVR